MTVTVATASTHAPHRRSPPGEAAGRRTLRAQIELLELRLAVLGAEVPTCVPAPPGRGPLLLDLGTLECSRDALLAEIGRARVALDRREERRAAARRRLVRMRAAPARHPFARVRLAELGEPGCGAYTVRPRLGLLGMLAGWWEVRLSSGCP
jgi:hypothetical protein